MLFYLSATLSIVIFAGLVIPIIPIVKFVRKLGNPPPEALPQQQYPPVAILLSLRGGDPFLADCLNRLLEQDYPDYELIIALDSETDPASKFVDQVIAEKQPPNLTKRIISDRSPNCTLLNNNYAHLVEELDDRFELVVMVDADAVTWPSWLRTLVQPMIQDPTIGGTSGNRWFTPDNVNLGTVTRAVWNMGSVIQMAMMNFPWGGSMALRAEVAKSSEMLECWRSSFTGDTPVYRVIKGLGLKYCFNPDIMLLNREDTTLRSFSNWMPRQMLNGRLYHPLWMPVLLQAFLSSIVVIGGMATNIVSILTGNWLAFTVLGTTLMVFWIAVFLLFIWMDRVICRKAADRGEKVDWLTPSAAHKVFWLIPLVQFLYFQGVLKCMVMRRVCWRGIDYVIDGPFDVTLVEYKPFVQEPQTAQQSL